MYLLPLTQQVPWHLAAISAAKWAVYDGFRAAIADAGLSPGEAGVIADEHSGATIVRDAAARGLMTVCTAGRASDVGFDGVGAHASTCEATYWKTVVSYNPEGDSASNGRQASRLSWIAERLRHRPRPRLMCDLVVPPTQVQLTSGIRTYGRRMLPGLTKRAIAQLLDAGVDPDVWVIEGFEREDEYREVVKTAARGGRPARSFVRAAGHSDSTTRDLMSVGLSVPGILGVVLPRAPFWESAVAWMSGRTTRAVAVATVRAQVRDWVSALEEPASFPMTAARTEHDTAATAVSNPAL
jgi:myo-inositol catabolism protein IolC